MNSVEFDNTEAYKNILQDKVNIFLQSEVTNDKPILKIKKESIDLLLELRSDSYKDNNNIDELIEQINKFIDKLIKKNITKCISITKDNKNCRYGGTYFYKDNFYCKTHYNKLTNRDNIIKCSDFNKDKTECKHKGIEFYKYNHYCKIHYKKIIKDNNIIKCSDFTKDNKKCNNKGIEFYKSDHYCKVHYNKQLKNDKKIEKEILKDKKKELLNKINIFLKTKVDLKNKEESIKIIKKESWRLLLEIHPDKCKYSDINSHDLTQKINIHIDKITK